MPPLFSPSTMTNPFFLPILVLLLCVAFYIGENVKERPSIFRAAVYVTGVIESFLYLTVVLS
ncbi:MAG: hypothetical protein AB9866_17760 [Syntrophobacteraceae bacterium]